MKKESMKSEARMLVTIVLLTVLPMIASIAARGDGDPVWHGITEFEIEGRGWTEVESPFDRLPMHAKGSVPDGVWGLSKQSAGLCARFVTTARNVSIRWTLTGEGLAMPHMPATGVSGVDLYYRAPDGSWQFAHNGRPVQRDDNLTTASLPKTGPARTECLLYLPLYNGVSRVEVGIPAGATIENASPRPEANRRPIAYYGTSIAQGGCASRPGMAHVAILGRMLDRPMINLGFSGSGRMEPAVSKLLSELDPALYVIDCLRNMGDIPEVELQARVTTLVETIRGAHPLTPILFVGRSEIHPGASPSPIEQLQAKTIRALTDKGTSGLRLFAGRTLLGADGDGTVDGVHPNDLGMRRQADALAPVLREMLSAGHERAL